MLNSITIPFHSFIDVITNSSTTVFVRASESSIKALKELVDIFLKAGGSNKTAEELFEFKIGVGKYEMDHAIDHYRDREQTSEFAKIPYDESYEKIKKAFEEGIIDFEQYADDEYPQSNALIITSKEDSKLTFDIIEKFESIFALDGYRNG